MHTFSLFLSMARASELEQTPSFTNIFLCPHRMYCMLCLHRNIYNGMSTSELDQTPSFTNIFLCPHRHIQRYVHIEGITYRNVHTFICQYWKPWIHRLYVTTLDIVTKLLPNGFLQQVWYECYHSQGLAVEETK
jgi:hypothetical protein